MNSLPIESPYWRQHLKQRIGLETAILRSLIQWGMAESSSDVCRGLEERFGDVWELQPVGGLQQSVRLSADDRSFVRELLNRVYMRTRDIPRRVVVQGRLHDGLLTGFEELAFEIVHSYEKFCFTPERFTRNDKAA